MTTDPFTETARTIDAHRENERWVGDGVKIECVCGHTSHATYDFSGPITEDKNNHRDAERMHAAHVAQVLAAQEPTDAEVEAGANAIIALLTGVALSAARAARRDEERR